MTKKLLHSTRSHKQKDSLQNRTNIYKGCNQQGTDFQNTQIAHMVQYLEKKKRQKMGRRSKQAFLQRRHTDDQQAHEKMLNTTNY